MHKAEGLAPMARSVGTARSAGTRTGYQHPQAQYWCSCADFPFPLPLYQSFNVPQAVNRLFFFFPQGYN